MQAGQKANHGCSGLVYVYMATKDTGTEKAKVLNIGGGEMPRLCATTTKQPVGLPLLLTLLRRLAGNNPTYGSS